MEVFIYIVFCILSLIGVSTVIRSLSYLIFKPNIKNKVFAVLLLDNENIEIKIRSAVEQMRINSFAPKKIFALDCGMDKKVKQQAVLLLDDYNIKLCNEENIGRLILNE